MPLENRTAVVTGASGGLGTVVALGLANHGSNLALLERDAQRLEALRDRLALPAARVMTLPVDLLDAQAARQAADSVAEHFGRVDILIHAVGGWTGGKALVDVDTRDLEAMLHQHVWTSFHAARAFVPHLVRNGWGRILMVTSPFAANPAAQGGPYAIAKAGQEALVLTLAQELRGTGVTANLLQAKTIDIRREKVAQPRPENASWTTPEEILAAMVFLLSEEASTVSGAKVPLFGASR